MIPPTAFRDRTPGQRCRDRKACCAGDISSVRTRECCSAWVDRGAILPAVIRGGECQRSVHGAIARLVMIRRLVLQLSSWRDVRAVAVWGEGGVAECSRRTRGVLVFTASPPSSIADLSAPQRVEPLFASVTAPRAGFAVGFGVLPRRCVTLAVTAHGIGMRRRKIVSFEEVGV